MKHFTNYLFALFILVGITISSCGLVDSDDPDNPNNNDVKTLNNTDFDSDMMLENRNDGIDYRITEQIYIDGNLEIEPGVTIEFDEAGSLVILDVGSIHAVGSSNDVITFTGTLKTKGSWGGIFIESTSLRNQFKHCIIEFAGNEEWGNGIQGALTTWVNAAFNVDNCTFRSNKVAAVQTYPHGIEIRSFENNRFENNDKSMIIGPGNVHQLGNTNEFADLDNVIEIQERTLFENNQSGESYTWKAHAAPYRIKHEMQIKDNHFTLEAGSTIEFSQTGRINVADQDASFQAIGTVTEPITLTGVDKVPGSWAGLEYNFSMSNKNQLEHCIIEYAGGTADNFDKGVIYMWATPRISVTNCTFRESASCIYFSTPTATLNENLTETNNTYTNTGTVFCD